MAAEENECPKCEKGAPKWMVTFGDLMSLLLTFFVLLLSYSNMDMIKYKEVLGSVEKAFGVQKERFELGKEGGMQQPIKFKNMDNKIEQEKDRLVNLLETMTREEQLENTMLITPDKRGVKMEIAGQVMFAPGGTELLPTAERIFRKLIPIIRQTIYKIIIEGHTDNTPITSDKFPSNWELSSARAGSAVRFLISEGNLYAKRFTAVGCAHTKAIAANDTPENRAKNRRVTIIFEIL
jgi:chemotaxis protein MotB